MHMAEQARYFSTCTKHKETKMTNANGSAAAVAVRRGGELRQLGATGKEKSGDFCNPPGFPWGFV